MSLLFLNSIGGFELIFILFAVLMLFGAKSIPSLAKTLGKGMREIKTASNEIKRDIQNSTLDMKKELNMENPFKEISEMIEDTGKSSAPKDWKKDNPETTLEAPVDSKPISNLSKKEENV